MINLSTLRSTVALIVIFGHILVFLVGFGLGVFSLLTGVDALQTLLMASPVLAVIGFGAFSNVMENRSGTEDKTKVTISYAILCAVFPILLIAVVLVLFYLFYCQLDHFGPDKLKISLGSVETFFGVYIGMISKSLFGYSPTPLE